MRSLLYPPKNRKETTPQRPLSEIAAELLEKEKNVKPESKKRRESRRLEASLCKNETIEKTIDRHKQKKINQSIKTDATQVRRNEFNKSRAQLLLQMLDNGTDYTCAVDGCMEETLTIDHIKSLTKGGSDELNNLQFMCAKHNSQKGSK